MFGRKIQTTNCIKFLHQGSHLKNESQRSGGLSYNSLSTTASVVEKWKKHGVKEA